MTNDQPTLWQQGPPARTDSIEERFWRFHADHPGVLAELHRLALQVKRRGFEQYSIKGLFEVLRFNQALKTHGAPFKLNNNYTALYARLLMDQFPELRGMFVLRERGSQQERQEDS